MCDRDRLGDRAWTKLRGPVQTVHLLWLKSLDLRLNPFERTRVVFIVTDTPEEYEALKKAAV